MPNITVLPKEIAELIAAGEVVDRPASVIKELVENAIDAGATRVTVEIQRGGILYMRVTDNGCGIAHEQVPLAFLRHATSKINGKDDLESIGTLGFRGEALAAASAVAKIELFTKTGAEKYGTHYAIEGGIEQYCEEVGCPDGTTMIVRDLFFNTPARMKFLKKDVSEGNTVAAIIERLALSHPEISFCFIREGKQVLQTAGDGKAQSVIYSVLGKELYDSLIPASGENGGVGVSGFICKPVFCRSSRNFQFTFLNGRYIRSGTVCAAVEQAYKNSAMVGKFPAFVLYLQLPFGLVDVNVHPAKTEVRFSDEKRIFDAVYGAVRSALSVGDTRPSVRFSEQPAAKPVVEETSEIEIKNAKPLFFKHKEPFVRLSDQSLPGFEQPKLEDLDEKAEMVVSPKTMKTVMIDVDEDEVVVPMPQKQEISQSPLKAEKKPAEISEEQPIRLIGEAFRTYIIAEYGKSVYFIDKHAAHERILFEDLKKNEKTETQLLLSPLPVKLPQQDYDAVVSNLDLLEKAGFEAEDFGNGTVLVRAIPAVLSDDDVTSCIEEAAASLSGQGRVSFEKLDHLYHTVACKAAIKAGYRTGDVELLSLAKRVLLHRDIFYCPHGRPVAYELKQHDLEKQFGRIQS
ncbi:MAG: DNA mismatch repair endonuclease MutL [Clostridia bacterium]|nr:DNA mismatch repair endonuclease MutL [Clostridia bacterium]